MNSSNFSIKESPNKPIAPLLKPNSPHFAEDISFINKSNTYCENESSSILETLSAIEKKPPKISNFNLSNDETTDRTKSMISKDEGTAKKNSVFDKSQETVKKNSVFERNKEDVTRKVTLRNNVNEETPIKDKEIAKKPYNFKLNLPKIIGNITEKQASKPYIITYDTSRSLSKKDSLMKQESDSKRSYKHENRVIHKKFDNFLKNLNKNESLQKFLTQDLKDDMGELNKELKKLNLEKEEDNCLRDIDPANFHTATNLRGNAYKKALKKISNLKL